MSADCGHEDWMLLPAYRAMTEHRVPTTVHRADCPLFAEGIAHEGFCPTDPQWRIRAMTEDRVPTPRRCPDCDEPIIDVAHWHEDRAMTKDRVPTTPTGRRLFTDNEPMDMLESNGVTPEDVCAIEDEARAQPAPPLDVRRQVVGQIKERFPDMGEQINPFDLYALLDEVARDD